MPGKRYDRQFKLSAARLDLEGEVPVRGLSDQLNVPCCTLGRWAAEYEADGEDAFPGNGNPVANKDYEILKLKKACGALGVGRGGRASDKGANVLNREFSVQKRNSVWCGDIAHTPTREGWPCLAIYLDLFSRKIVGWQVSPRINENLVIDALDNAVNRENPEE